jgi:hypothetical protein
LISGAWTAPSGRLDRTEGDHVKNQNRRTENLVVRKVDAGTWSVQKKAVPGFRLSKSSMASAHKVNQPKGSSER